MLGPAMHHGLHRSHPGAADRPLHGHDGGNLPPQLRGLRRYHRFRQVREALEFTLVLTLPVLLQVRFQGSSATHHLRPWPS